METSKAPTRHFCRQTCVRRSLTRGCSGRCPLPVCQSVFLFFFSSARYVPICANMVQGRADTCGIGLIRADLGRISPYRPQPPIPAPNWPIQAEIQKKKKVAKRTVWEKITKPYLYLSSHFSPIHSLILIFSSLSLSVSGLCAPWLSASGLCSPSVCLPSLTQSHSHTHTSQSHSQLTHNLTDPVTHSQVSTQLSQLKSQVLTHSQVSTHSQPHQPGDTLSLSSCFSYYLLLLLNLVYIYIM